MKVRARLRRRPVRADLAPAPATAPGCDASGQRARGLRTPQDAQMASTAITAAVAPFRARASARARRSSVAKVGAVATRRALRASLLSRNAPPVVAIGSTTNAAAAAAAAAAREEADVVDATEDASIARPTHARLGAVAALASAALSSVATAALAVVDADGV